MRASATSAAPDLARARQELQRIRGYAGLVEQFHRRGGDQWSFFRGLGEHRVARCQRRGQLAGEDGQREVPRRDADYGAERAMAVVVEIRAHLGAVIAQEIDRLADFSHRIRQ